MSKKNITFAIIGFGIQGKKFAEALRTSGFQLKAVYSSDPVRAFETLNDDSVAYYDSIKTLCVSKKITHAIVASPNHLHFAHTKILLEHGINVLVEKPFVLSTREALTLIKLEAKTKARICVGFQLRTKPVFEEARRIIKTKSLGNITFIETLWSAGNIGKKKLGKLPIHMAWREDIARSGGGALMARGVHMIDIVSYLLGAQFDSVSAAKEPRTSNTTDITFSALLHSGKTLISLTTSKMMPLSVDHVTIYGTKGILRITHPYSPNKEAQLELITERGTEEKVFTIENSLEAEIKAFVSDRKKLANSQDGLQNVRVTEAIATSLSKGKETEIKK